MTLYIGVDIHPYRQTVAYCRTEDGEIKFRSFKHEDKGTLKAFYGGFGESAVVGVEATGSLDWFEDMIFENGHEFLVGNPYEIRRRAKSRHKSDRRDAETILDLLVNGEFPSIGSRSREERGWLQLLSFRQHLVQQRTSVANQLQSLSRKNGLSRFSISTKIGRGVLLAAKMDATDDYLRASLYALYDDLSDRVKKVDKALDQAVATSDRAALLMTHSGVGVKTALALAATLGDVSRFQNSRQVVSFVGLDPLDKSSGEKKRTGRISKSGSRLCRYLLVQAANRSQNPQIREAYQRTTSRRGHAIAKIAIARRLLINCYTMLRDAIDYSEFCRRGEVGLHESTLASN